MAPERPDPRAGPPAEPPTAVSHRLAELVARFGLDAGQELRLRALLGLLAEDEHAPTPIRASAEAVDAHVADSLTGLDAHVLRAARRIADLGAGAGFPGIPLAIALPEATVALVESSGRKCAFMGRALERTRTANAEIVNARAEDWTAGVGLNDVVTARALAPLAVLCEYAAPLLSVGGHLVAWKGRSDPDEERDATAAADQLGLELAGVQSVRPFGGARDRHLYVYVKVRDTPERFPRRPGIARKRPLGA
jgi:16S rRNA (guanine527-N7)-methyltransferase